MGENSGNKRFRLRAFRKRVTGKGFAKVMESESNLAGKRVLFIAPMFFGYEKLIQAELEAKGAEVDYFNDRPDNGFWTKALIRVDRRLLARKTERYYNSIIESTRSQSYDHV